MPRTRYEEKEIETECPKCNKHSKVKTNNFFDSIYSCPNCGEIIIVKKIK